MMKHRAMATLTIPLIAVFEDDGVHPLVDQAAAALEAEAEWRCCLKPEEIALSEIKTKAIGIG